MIAHGKDIKVFTGNSNPQLAKDICTELGIPLGNSEVGAFSDGENFASIYETVRGSDVFVVQSTCSFEKDGKPGTVNDSLMEQLIMIHTFPAPKRRLRQLLQEVLSTTEMESSLPEMRQSIT